METITKTENQNVDIEVRENENENNVLPDYLQDLNLEFRAKEIKKITPLSEIAKKIKFNIKDIKKIKTKFGIKVRIIIVNKRMGVESEYTTYLPDRFKNLTQGNIDILIKNPNIYFWYSGKDNNGCHVVEFVT
jgi:hypothetical protein